VKLTAEQSPAFWYELVPMMGVCHDNVLCDMTVAQVNVDIAQFSFSR
jgi:hypothetical protein